MTYAKRKQKFSHPRQHGQTREFQYYASGIPTKNLCRMLDRHEHAVKDWLNGKAVIPCAIRVLRLNCLEHQLMLDQMGFTTIKREH